MDAAPPAALFSPEFLSNPFPTYAYLRQNDPVCFVPKMNAWIITRHEDAVAALKDRRFSSRLRAEPGDVGNIPLFCNFQENAIEFADHPDHTRLRGMMQRNFTPAIVNGLRDKITAIVCSLLDAMAGREQIDFIQDFAYPLPTTVIAELVGVPPSERHLFRTWSHGIIEGFDMRASPEQQTACNDIFRDFREYVLDLADQRRRQPREDLMSRLVEVKDREDGSLSDEELAYNCIFLLVAGHETSTSLLYNGLLALLQHPDQFNLLKSHPEWLPSAVEEMARDTRPLQMVPRILREDLTFAGKQLREGQTVMVFLASANHDPQVFANPETFDIQRNPNPHIAFGHGIHHCLGAPLARVEVPIAFREFMQRYPHIRLDDRPLERIVSLRNATLKSLPIWLH